MDALVLVPPIFALGTAYGALAIDAGLSSWLTIVTSVIVVSTAAQFTAISLLTAGWLPVLVACTGLAVRHVPMSATLGAILKHESPGVRAALSWVLVDESYGLTLNRLRDGEIDPVSYKAAADLVLYGSWLAATVTGVLIGPRLSPDTIGTEAILPLLYVTLVAGLAKGQAVGRVVIAALAATVAAVAILPSAWQVSVAALCGAIAGGRGR